MGGDANGREPAGGDLKRRDPARRDPKGHEPACRGLKRRDPARRDPKGHEPAGGDLNGRESAGADVSGRESVGAVRLAEWAALGEWLSAPPPLLHKVDLDVLRERVGFIGRARSTLAAMEAEVVGEIARREGDAAAEEMLRRDQKRSRRGARKTVKTAGQLEWAPTVAEKLAEGAITPEAAGLILEAAGEVSVDQRALLKAAEEEPEDQFRRTVKDHVNRRTSEEELQRRRERQRSLRRASISEQGDGMFHLFAQLDPLTGARVKASLISKSDQLFRGEDPKNRPTAPQRFADALTELICTNDSAGGSGASGGAGRGGGAGSGNGIGAGSGAPAGVELLVLADYDQVHDAITNARLTDGTRLTEAETLAVACDAKILPGIFNKHTGNPLLGRSRRKVSSRHRKRLVARDGGCIGCGASHTICEVHHDHHWAHGGETTLDNTCLVCWRCHHIRIHLHGEQITRHPNGRRTLAPPNAAGGDSKGPSRPPPHNHRPHPSQTAGTPTRPDTPDQTRHTSPDSPPRRSSNHPSRPRSPAAADTHPRPSPECWLVGQTTESADSAGRHTRPFQELSKAVL